MTVPTAAGVEGGARGGAGMVASSLTMPLVAPGVLGVTGEVDAPLSAPRTVRKPLATLQYCQLLFWINQGATGAF